jgi:hypothetical protein
MVVLVVLGTLHRLWNHCLSFLLKLDSNVVNLLLYYQYIRIPELCQGNCGITQRDFLFTMTSPTSGSSCGCNSVGDKVPDEPEMMDVDRGDESDGNGGVSILGGGVGRYKLDMSECTDNMKVMDNSEDSGEKR